MYTSIKIHQMKIKCICTQQDIFINKILHLHLLPWLRKLRGPSLPYEELEKEMALDPRWPPFTTSRPSNDVMMVNIELNSTRTKPAYDRENSKGVCFSQSYDSVSVKTEHDTYQPTQPSGIALKRQSAQLSSNFAVLSTDNFMARPSKSMSALHTDRELKLWKESNRRSYAMDTDCYL